MACVSGSSSQRMWVAQCNAIVCVVASRRRALNSLRWSVRATTSSCVRYRLRQKPSGPPYGQNSRPAWLTAVPDRVRSEEDVSAGNDGVQAVNKIACTAALIPRNAGVLFLRAYRAGISPLYGDVCRYYPSCSAYALGAVQEHGLVIGSALAARRLARCHPWAEGGIDDVPQKCSRRHTVTSFGFVVAPSHGKG